MVTSEPTGLRWKIRLGEVDGRRMWIAWRPIAVLGPDRGVYQPAFAGEAREGVVGMVDQEMREAWARGVGAPAEPTA